MTPCARVSSGPPTGGRLLVQGRRPPRWPIRAWGAPERKVAARAGGASVRCRGGPARGSHVRRRFVCGRARGARSHDNALGAAAAPARAPVRHGVAHRWVRADCSTHCILIAHSLCTLIAHSSHTRRCPQVGSRTPGVSRPPSNSAYLARGVAHPWPRRCVSLARRPPSMPCGCRRHLPSPLINCSLRRCHTYARPRAPPRAHPRAPPWARPRAARGLRTMWRPLWLWRWPP